jgi:hypothetical protein
MAAAVLLDHSQRPTHQASPALRTSRRQTAAEKLSAADQTVHKRVGAWYCHIPFTRILRSHRAEQTSTQKYVNTMDRPVNVVKSELQSSVNADRLGRPANVAGLQSVDQNEQS